MRENIIKIYKSFVRAIGRIPYMVEGKEFYRVVSGISKISIVSMVY